MASLFLEIKKDFFSNNNLFIKKKMIMDLLIEVINMLKYIKLFVVVSLDLVFLLPLIGIIFSIYYSFIRETFTRRCFFILFSLFTFIQNSLVLNGHIKDFEKVYKPINFDIISSHYSFSKNIDWYIVIDNISALHMLIAAYVVLICVILSVFHAKKSFSTIIFILYFVQFLLYNCFGCPNFFMFYVFFEASLIPFFLIVAKWGSREEFRLDAANRLIFFTLFFSAPLYIILVNTYTDDLGVEFTHIRLFNTIFFYSHIGLVLAALCSFIVKIPIVPFHSWLPDAHGEAPTIGSILLAGIILKLGTYGYFRYAYPYLTTEVAASIDFRNGIIFVAVITLVVTIFLLIGEIDMKRLIAIFSVNHIASAVVSISLKSTFGTIAGIVINLSHCFSSIGLFFVIGLIYSRTHSKKINDVRGLVIFSPKASIFLFLFFLANMAFPMTLNFLGEFFSITATTVFFNIDENFFTNSYFTNFFSFIWYFFFISSIIITGFISIRLIVITIFTSDSYYKSKNSSYSNYISPEEPVDEKKEVTTISYIFNNRNTFNVYAIKELYKYELLILFVITVSILLFATSFLDVGAFFDPKSSYSGRAVTKWFK